MNTREAIRLLCIFFLDEHRDDLIELHRCMSRGELDARNSPVLFKTLLEKVANKFNDKGFVASTPRFPNAHKHFAEPMSITLENGMTHMTDKLAKDKLRYVELESEWKWKRQSC